VVYEARQGQWKKRDDFVAGGGVGRLSEWAT
jgi:hypothetical protein